jgi:hypothetical protein
VSSQSSASTIRKKARKGHLNVFHVGGVLKGDSASRLYDESAHKVLKREGPHRLREELYSSIKVLSGRVSPDFEVCCEANFCKIFRVMLYCGFHNFQLEEDDVTDFDTTYCIVCM